MTYQGIFWMVYQLGHCTLKCHNNIISKDVHYSTEALEGHFSYYLQLICYSLIVITYLLMLTWFHIDMPNSDCYVPDFM